MLFFKFMFSMYKLTFIMLLFASGVFFIIFGSKLLKSVRKNEQINFNSLNIQGLIGQLYSGIYSIVNSVNKIINNPKQHHQQNNEPGQNSNSNMKNNAQQNYRQQQNYNTQQHYQQNYKDPHEELNTPGQKKYPFENYEYPEKKSRSTFEKITNGHTPVKIIFMLILNAFLFAATSLAAREIITRAALTVDFPGIFSSMVLIVAILAAAIFFVSLFVRWWQKPHKKKR